MKELLNLFLTFFKIGLTTFGGGYAMLPILEREIVKNKKWATNEELANYYAIGQCTPGIISVNTATFIGYKRKGILGGIISTLGIVSPSILIILLIANLISNFIDFPITKHIFAGINISVSALIISAVIKLWKNSIVDKTTFFIFLTLFILSILFNISPVIIIILSGLLGLLKRSDTKK